MCSPSNLPKSWCVRANVYSEFYIVVHYMNLHGNGKIFTGACVGSYYGLDKDGEYVIEDEKKNFEIELTIKQFKLCI